MREELLAFRGVTRSFLSGEGEINALSNITFSIRSGEFIAIVGASGSGKSTLLNIIGCLDHPTSGSYIINGIETIKLGAEQLSRLRREYFGFVFQRYNLISHLNAIENVEVPAVYAGIYRNQRHTRARDLLIKLGLSERLHHLPGQLSGGQQQRISIARALINGGEIILADEPTGALDTKNGQEIIQILHELHAHGHTVIVVTHDRNVAANADRVIEMSDGVIVKDYTRDLMSGDSPTSPRKIDSFRATAGSKSSSDMMVPGYSGPVAKILASRIFLFIEAFHMARRALLSHKMRSLLTMLGVIIGIASVVSTAAIGEGGKRYVLTDIKSIGANTINIYPGRGWGDSHASTIHTLVPGDAEALSTKDYVDSVTPLVAQNSFVQYGNINARVVVSGVGENFFNVRGFIMSEGIAFGADDVGRQAQVAVIDNNTRNKIFANRRSALGEVIMVGGLPCIVIGIVADNKNIFDDPSNLNVWIPYSTASSRLFGVNHLKSIIVRIREGQSGELADADIKKILISRHGGADFFTYNMDTIVKTVEKTSKSLSLLLSTIASVSLIVGGIGVMNVMIVSVTERVHEIGIRMAVGARQTDIMQQFLVEAVLICLSGGILGILFSFVIGEFFSIFITDWDMIYSVQTIIVACVFSAVLGVVFGFIPSFNASRMHPVDSLSHD